MLLTNPSGVRVRVSDVKGAALKAIGYREVVGASKQAPAPAPVAEPEPAPKRTYRRKTVVPTES